MAPGLGLVSDLVIDTHFAERGRMGRLLGAVSQNPKNIGVGIDEDTAIIVERAEKFRVIGSGAIYVVDGQDVSYTSLSEKNPEGVLTLHDVKLHVLGEGDDYDLIQRRPILPREVVSSVS
jgi:cyanophycinase